MARADVGFAQERDEGKREFPITVSGAVTCSPDTIYKRFSEFFEFDRQLRGLPQFSDIKLGVSVALPPKIKRMNDTKMQSRRAGLHAYVEEVLLHPAVRVLPCVISFLCLRVLG